MSADAAANHDPRTSLGRRAMATFWLGLSLAVASCVWLADWSARVPAPAGGDAPAQAFSEARALETVRVLADEIGPHPLGSPEAKAAAQWLVARLRELPRVDVVVQDAQGVTHVAMVPNAVIHYQVRNVIARLPGRHPEALLIGAHYDSPPEAPGASDNGSGTAAVVETLRALSAGPQLEQTIIALLDGGEEMGQTGAAGFLHHPWSRDVRAFLDLESLGAGKATAIVASTDRPGLIDAYVRAAPAPLAHPFFADVTQSGVLLATGNFEPYLRAGIPGLELATFGNPWLIHTRRDHAAALEPGSLQHLGDTLLGVSRELAAKPFSLEQGSRRVCFDLWGVACVAYGVTTGRLLAAGALVLLIGVIVQLVRRREVALGALAAGLGWTLLGLLAALLAALAAAALLAIGLGRPHGWYATPWLVVPAFGAPALCALAAVHALWRRRARRAGSSPEQAATTSWLSGVLFWGLLLVLGTIGGAGVSIMALAWVVPSCLALAAARSWPHWRWRLWALCLAMGALFSLPLARLMVPALAGMAGGMVGIPLPQDFTLAVVLWLMGVVPLAPCLFAAGHRVGGLGRVAQVLGVVAVVGIVVTARAFPYRTDRPKRLLVTHAEVAGKTNVLLASFDPVPLAPAVAALPGLEPVGPGEPWPEAFLGVVSGYRYKLPAKPIGIAPPRLEVTTQSELRPDGTRVLVLRLWARGWTASLELPRAAVAGWSFGELPGPAVQTDKLHVLFTAPSELGETFELTLRGAGPVPATLQQIQAPGRTPELLEVEKLVPSWANPRTQALQQVEVEL